MITCGSDQKMAEAMLSHAALGDLPAVQAAAEVIGIDAQDENGMTGTIIAASFGHFDIVSWFVDSGADVNILDACGDSAFHYAAYGGRVDILSKLEPHTSAHVQNCLNNDGYAPIHTAVAHGELDAVRGLFSSPHIDINARTENGWTSIHIAAASGFTSLVEFLLTANGFDVMAVDAQGSNALHVAAFAGQLPVVIQLVESGQFDPNAKGENKATAFAMACAEGSLAVVIYLSRLTQPGLDADGDTELHLAVKHLPVAQFLLDHMYDVCAITNDGSTALHRAVGNGSLDVVAKLIEAKSPLDARDVIGCTPFYNACYFGDLPLVKLLLHGKSDARVFDLEGFSPLHAAAQSGNLRVVGYLVQRLGLAVDLPSTRGFTPIMCAISLTRTSVVKWLVKRGADCKTAIEVAKRYENSGEEARKLSEWLARPCGAQGCAQRGSKKCGGCLQIRYCGTACQRAHREVHKHNCFLSL